MEYSGNTQSQPQSQPTVAMARLRQMSSLVLQQGRLRYRPQSVPLSLSVSVPLSVPLCGTGTGTGTGTDTRTEREIESLQLVSNRLPLRPLPRRIPINSASAASSVAAATAASSSASARSGNSHSRSAIPSRRPLSLVVNTVLEEEGEQDGVSAGDVDHAAVVAVVDEDSECSPTTETDNASLRFDDELDTETGEEENSRPLSATSLSSKHATFSNIAICPSMLDRCPQALQYPSLRVIMIKNANEKCTPLLQSFILHIFDSLLALSYRDGHGAGVDILREAATRVASHEHICHCQCFCHVHCALHNSVNKRLKEVRAVWNPQVEEFCCTYIDMQENKTRETMSNLMKAREKQGATTTLLSAAMHELVQKVLHTSNSYEIDKTKAVLLESYRNLSLRVHMNRLRHKIRIGTKATPKQNDNEVYHALAGLFDINHFDSESFEELAKCRPERPLAQRILSKERQAFADARKRQLQKQTDSQRVKEAAAFLGRPLTR